MKVEVAMEGAAAVIVESLEVRRLCWKWNWSAVSSAAGRKDVVALAAALGGFSVAVSAGYGGWGEILDAWRGRHGFGGFYNTIALWKQVRSKRF